MLIRLGLEDVKVVLSDAGALLQYSAVSFLVPIFFVFLFGEPIEFAAYYLVAGAIAFIGGYFLKRTFSSSLQTDIKHAFFTASVVWLLYPLIAAIPFILILGMTPLNAFFETISAVTTTGLTVMQNIIDSAPLSLLFWRSLVSWIGGVGIVVMALTGILSTYSRASKWVVAEGQQEHLKPNIRNTVKEIWGIYAGLTVVGIILLCFAGMGLFPALNYSMSALSTTGMDLSRAGLNSPHNPLIDWVLILLMFLGGISFSVHYLLFRKRRPDILLKDAEFKVMILIAVATTLLILPKFLIFHGSNYIGLKNALFHAVSSLTGGGFSLASESGIFAWDDFVKLVLVAAMFIGGCSGSTAGGIKISRFIILAKSVCWKIRSSVLPSKSFFARKFEGQNLDDRAIKNITQFVMLYALFIFIGVLVVTASGYDLGSALFEVVSAQSNVGIGNGIAHAGMPIAVEVMLILNMWIGRLEIIPVLATIGFLLSLKAKS